MFIGFLIIETSLTGCEKGSFGIDCQNRCGHCLDHDQCYHTNGTCLTGCDVGYQGHLCTTRRYCLII